MEDDGEAGMEPRDDTSPDWNGRNSGGSSRDLQRSGANQAGSRRGAEVPDFGAEHLIGELDSEDPPTISSRSRNQSDAGTNADRAESLVAHSALRLQALPFSSCFPKKMRA